MQNYQAKVPCWDEQSQADVRPKSEYSAVGVLVQRRQRAGFNEGRVFPGQWKTEVKGCMKSIWTTEYKLLRKGEYKTGNTVKRWQDQNIIASDGIKGLLMPRSRRNKPEQRWWYF